MKSPPDLLVSLLSRVLRSRPTFGNSLSMSPQAFLDLDFGNRPTPYSGHRSPLESAQAALPSLAIPAIPCLEPPNRLSACSPLSHGISMPAVFSLSPRARQTPVQGVVKVQGIDHVWQLVDGQLMLETFYGSMGVSPPPRPPSTTPPPSPPAVYHNLGAAHAWQDLPTTMSWIPPPPLYAPGSQAKVPPLESWIPLNAANAGSGLPMPPQPCAPSPVSSNLVDSGLFSSASIPPPPGGTPRARGDFEPGDRTFWVLPVLGPVSEAGAAIRPSDWFYRIALLLRDLSAGSWEWYQRVQEAAMQYYQEYQLSDPLRRGQIRPDLKSATAAFVALVW